MYRVEMCARVRRACRVAGMSTRQASRVFGLDRKTVRKMLSFSVPPGYRRRMPRRRPKLDAFTGIIDRILEDDRAAASVARDVRARRLRSAAASPAPSCTPTPSGRLPASWAMESGSERASSRSCNLTICSRTGSAGRARATTRARSRGWSASSGGTSSCRFRGLRASRR